MTDLTFVPTWAGVAYVCFLVDVYSRMIVGWRVASHLRTTMVFDAVEMARWSRENTLPHLLFTPMSGRSSRPFGTGSGLLRSVQRTDETYTTRLPVQGNPVFSAQRGFVPYAVS